LILDTRVATTGGYGVFVSERGSGLVERSVIYGSTQAGAVAGDPGASLHLRDVAVRDVVPRARDGVGGWGVRAIYGARLVAERLLVERVSSAGVMAYAEDADVTLTDVIVVDLVAFDRGHIHGARVAVLDARGAGVVSAAFVREGAGATVFGATVAVEDLFVRGVRPSTVDSTNARAPAAAYGVFVGRDCAGDLARATLTDADWGFFHSAGSLTLRRALLARQRRGAGAANLVDASHPLRLEDLRFRENASDVIQRDIDLPTLRLEPPPEPALPRLSP
jgi:hypothetical protein